MSPQLEAAAEIAAFMDARGWRYCLIGGLAVQQWGEARLTHDADFTLLTGWGFESTYMREVFAHFEKRYDDADVFAERHRILLIRASNGIDVDISLGAIMFEEEMIARATLRSFAPALKLRCCTAEDLFIMKAFASRATDWRDAVTIVARQRKLDTDYIVKHLAILTELKETPEILQRAKEVLKINT